MAGATKHDRKSGASFSLPVCANTRSGFQSSWWLTTYFKELDAAGDTSGYLFSTRGGKKSKLSDFEDEFYSTLEGFQQSAANGKWKLIPKTMDVREEFGIWRSLRRGATAHAIKQGVSPDLIHLVNRWRCDDGKHHGSMDLYSELESLIPTTKKYSLAL